MALAFSSAGGPAALSALCEGEDPPGEDSHMLLPEPGPSLCGEEGREDGAMEVEGALLTGGNGSVPHGEMPEGLATPMVEEISDGGRKASPPPPTTALAELFKGGGRSTIGGTTILPAELEDVYPVIEGVVAIPASDLAIARRAWSSAVIGKFLGRSVGLELMSKALSSKWQTKGKVEIIPMDMGFFTFRFSESGDVQRVLTGGPWVVAGQALALESWRPNFCAATDTITRTPVWLRLPNLPVEYWSPKTIRSIDAAAGRPIALDDYTCALARGKFARVCVEIELRNPLCPGVFVGEESRKLWQRFEYENVTLLCFTCGVVGHVASECGGKKGVPSEQGSAPSKGENSVGVEDPKIAVGPWTLVERRRRGGPSFGAPRRGAPERVGSGGSAGRTTQLRDSGASRGMEQARPQVRSGILSNSSSTRITGRAGSQIGGPVAGVKNKSAERVRPGDARSRLAPPRSPHGGARGGAAGMKGVCYSGDAREGNGMSRMDVGPPTAKQVGRKEPEVTAGGALAAGGDRCLDMEPLGIRPLGEIPSLCEGGTALQARQVTVANTRMEVGAGADAEEGEKMAMDPIFGGDNLVEAGRGVCLEVGEVGELLDNPTNVLCTHVSGMGGGKLKGTKDFAFAAGAAPLTRGFGPAKVLFRGESRGSSFRPPHRGEGSGSGAKPLTWHGTGQSREVRRFSIEPGGLHSRHGETVLRLEKAVLQCTNEASSTGMNGDKRTRTGGVEDEDCQGSLV